MAGISLRDYQTDAVERMKNGCILCGGVGSGKSRTALAYYYKQNGGKLGTKSYIRMPGTPKDLYIITTARKRDTLEWEGELSPFLLSVHAEVNTYKNMDREPYHRNWIESVIVDEDITSPHKVWMTPFDVLRCTIEMLNAYRENYLETKDKQDWWQMIQLLPSSYNQRRTVMLNYEVLANIYKSRRNHKLDEWHTFCDWIESLPYSELITGEKKG